jgi:uncharacterized protein (TIGR00730 family)
MPPKKKPVKKNGNKKLKVVLPKKLKKDALLLSPDKVEEMMEIHKEGVSPWRVFKIISEFVSGYEFVRHYKRAVTIFGSARYGFNHQVYKDATRLAHDLSKEGFAVVTGGGPGIMEAANKGASQAGGESVGLNIQLPLEQRINKYVNEATSFHYFFTRKVMLASVSQIYIYFPGGYGTMDELFEVLTLVQTKKIVPVSIILVNREFWTPLVDFLRETVYKKNKAISKSDLDLFHLVDHADEALEYINKHLSKKIRPREDMMENNPEGTIMSENDWLKARAKKSKTKKK